MNSRFVQRTLALTALALMAVTRAAAPDAAPTPDIHVVADEPFGSDDRQHAVVGISEWAPGAATKRHYHAGDEYALVLEGAIEIDNEGQPPHVYKVGESYHNKRGVIHVARNAINGHSKMSFVLISDKGSPLQVMVDEKR
jgi:quercetin dioxygenase-like cupin family protein